MAKGTTAKPGVTKKNGSVSASGVTIQNLIIRPIERTNLDVQKWRNAHQHAEGYNGKRILLYDLYDDVLLDGFLNQMVRKRILGVTRAPLQFVDKKGKKIDAVETLLKSHAFRKLRKAIQAQKAWGISVIELANQNGKLHVFDVPKKHILAAEGLIIKDQHEQSSDIKYREKPLSNTVVEIGEWNDLGYLLQAAAYVIYKRGGVADWANFAQMFGMPFREARYDGFNEAVKIQLEQAMEKAGSAAYAVLPKEAEFKFHEAKNTGNNADLYDALRKAMNEEIMVHVLGSTETTISSKSSGYAQSETHSKSISEVAEDDREDELAILNEKVVPILQYLGLVPEGFFASEQSIDFDKASKMVDVGLKLRKGGVPVDDDFFYETSGVPKPKDYDQIKAKEAETANDPADGTDDPPQPQKPPKSKATAQEKKLSATLEKVELMLQRMDDFFADAPKD